MGSVRYFKPTLFQAEQTFFALTQPPQLGFASSPRSTAERKNLSADVQEGGSFNDQEFSFPSEQDKATASIKEFEASICLEAIENGRFYDHAGIPATKIIKGYEADIEFAVRNNLKEIRAVTCEGVTMSFGRTGDNWGEDALLVIQQAKMSFRAVS